MRFARQARIFRGTLDPAAVAGVFLLLVIFLLLSSLIYTPGVLVELGNGAQVSSATISITRAGEVVFDGKTNAPGELEQLRQDLKRSPHPPPYTLQIQPGAPAKLIEQVRALVQIDPPVGRSLVGTDNPHVMLAVNFRGQCFFDNQMVSDIQLRAKLKERVAAARRQSKELTLILWMDRATENQVQTRLMQLAGEVGVGYVILAERPGLWASPPQTFSPK
jgi:biopolymer transport protein ExbD